MEKCPNCGGKKSYSDKYDSYYCKKCLIWLEEKCTNSKCEFCSKRPKKPSRNLKGF